MGHFRIDIGQAGFVGGGVTQFVGQGSRHLRLEEVIDESHGIVGMLGVSGYGQVVKEDQAAGFGQQHFDVLAALVFIDTGNGDIEVTCPTQGHASFAASNVVDHGAREQTNVFANLGQHLASRFVVRRIIRVSILADVVQGRWQDFGG